MAKRRTNTPEVVDLTLDVTPQRPSRKKKSTFIDLTTPETSSSLATATSTAAANGTSEPGVCEIVYESRSTPVPPTRRAGLKRAAAHVDLADSDDSDFDLPSVHIPGQKKKSPEKPPLNIPTCSVCLETVPELQANNIDLIITTSCNHFFCKPCIVESLKVAKTCPRCRVALRGKVPYKTFYF